MQSFFDWLYSYGTTWHDTWEVVGALATFATVLLSVSFAWVEVQRRKIAERERNEAREGEARERKRNDDERRQSQARHVAPWLETRGTPDGPLVFGIVGNFSEAPIFDVWIAVMSRGSSPVSVTMENGDPSTAVLAPGGEFSYPLRKPSVFEPRGYRIEVTFRDTAGTTWIRSGDGGLQAQPEILDW